MLSGASDSADKGNGMVAVQDPLDDHRFMRYSQFRDNYLGRGQWKYTCLTHRAKPRPRA